MKKLLRLSKMLLVAVGLLAGGASSVWAQAKVIYERGYETAWTAADAKTSGTDTDVWVGNFGYNEESGLYASATGNRCSVLTFSHTDNSLQTFDIVFNNLINTGDGGNYSYIKIGSDIEIQSNQQNQTGAVIINGVSTSISNCNQKNKNRGGDKWAIHVEINTANKTLTALTLTGTEMNGMSASYTLAKPTVLGNTATFNTVTIGFNRVKGTPAAALTSIKIAEEAQDVTAASYTINYNFDGSAVKTENGSSTVGATINAELPITVDGQKYYAADGATTSMTLIDGTNVLNVDLRKANEYVYSVKNNFGTVYASGTYIEGESAINVSWSKYVKNDDVWYECDGDVFSTTITGALDETINYGTATNFAYFVECENMNVSRSAAASDANSAYSNGVMVRHYSSSYWYTDALAAGKYTVTIPWKNNNKTTTIINIYLRDGEGKLTDTGEALEGTYSSSGTYTSGIIEIPAGYSIVLNNAPASNSNVLMDYVALAPAPVSATIGSAGWATLYTDKALDFSGVTGLTAYTATCDGSTVTLTPVDNVPANTGVVLKGVADTYSIPVIASSTTAQGDLQGSATATAFNAFSGYDLYMLAKNGSEAQFKKVSSGSIPGKAFLKVAAKGDAPALDVVFGDATGIEAVKKAETVADGAYYNLAGQRVAQPTKGLYIVNGKKVVIK